MEYIDYDTPFGLITCEVYDSFGLLHYDSSIRYLVVPVCYELNALPELEECFFRCNERKLIPIMLEAIVDDMLYKSLYPLTIVI